MASATKKIERRTKTVEENVTVVNLTLESAEAAALLQAIRSIGGPRANTGRKHIDSVLRALELAGVKPSGEDMTGSLYFGDFLSKVPSW